MCTISGFPDPEPIVGWGAAGSARNPWAVVSVVDTYIVVCVRVPRATDDVWGIVGHAPDVYLVCG